MKWCSVNSGCHCVSKSQDYLLVLLVHSRMRTKQSSAHQMGHTYSASQSRTAVRTTETVAAEKEQQVRGSQPTLCRQHACAFRQFNNIKKRTRKQPLWALCGCQKVMHLS